jgi:hypothetical protein
MTDSQQHLLLIYPLPSLDTNPTLVLLLESLAKRRVRVDVLLTTGEGFLTPQPFGETIHLRGLPRDFFFKPFALKGLPLRFAKRLIPSNHNVGYPIRFDHVVFRYTLARQYSAVIGVDPHGMILAGSLNKYAKRPLVYISFEIIFSEDLDDSEIELKHKERLVCDQTSLVLVQDEERAEAFCRENSFPFDRVSMIPVAPAPQKVEKSDYLRKTLKIPSNKQIVLYCGNLEAWASRDELAEMVSYWPDAYCLVIHSRCRVEKRMRNYLKSLTDTRKIIISTEPVERKDMCSLVSSADFGLAPYKPIPDAWQTAKNLYHLGLSSGKISYYALCGLPILARSLPVFEREFSNYQCGKTYRRLAETGTLLEEMSRDYDNYSRESKRFYDKRLNPVDGMNKFCDRLMELARGSGE